MVRILHGWRRCAVLLAATAGLVTLPASAALASHTDNGTSDALSGCVQGIGAHGGFLHVAARDGLTWVSPHDAVFDFADQTVAVHDCGPSDPRISGGRVTFSSTVEFFGDQLTSCSVGFPSGVSCSYNPTGIHIVGRVTRPAWANNGGTASLKIGNVEETTGNSGSLVSTRFTTSDSLGTSADVAFVNTKIDHHI